MTDMVSLETLDKLLAEGKISSADYEEQKKILFRRSLRESGERANPKSGIIYILLAFFLGKLGVHNFYAGFWKRGLVQLFLSLTASMFLFLPLIVTSLWALFELLLKRKSADGYVMSGSRKLIWGLRLLALVVFISVALSANYVDLSLPIADEDLSSVSDIVNS